MGIVSNKALSAKRYCFVAFETMRNCHTFLISLVLCIVIKSSSTRFLLVEVEKENDRALKNPVAKEECPACCNWENCCKFELCIRCGEDCDRICPPCPNGIRKVAMNGKNFTKAKFDESLDENAQTKARDRVCCKANTAECRACSLGMTLEEYCTQNPDTIGCFRDIVVTNGSLESVPHPQPKWLAIEGAEDCLTKMKMGNSNPVCVHLVQSEFCKNDAWKQLRKLVEAKELKQCYGSDKDLRIQLEQENRSQPGSEGDLQRSRDANKKGNSKCNVTMADQEGPFFEAGAPNTNMLVPESERTSKDFLKLVGRVLDKNCNPIRNAKVQCWYAGGNPVHYTFPPAHLWYRGYVLTDKGGRYSFDATFPGVYDIRPIIHYHMKAITKIKTLTTQIYFKGHIPPAYEDYVKGRDTQYPKSDFVFENVQERQRTIEFDLVMDY